MAHELRNLDDRDVDGVVDLWDRCGLVRSWNDPHRDIERSRADGVAQLVAVDESGGIIGSALVGYDGHRGWANYVAVDPTHRGTGLGRALMAEAEERLRSLGCPKLNLQVRLGNDDAIEFYKSLGYEIDAAVSMGKRLIPDE